MAYSAAFLPPAKPANTVGESVGDLITCSNVVLTSGRQNAVTQGAVLKHYNLYTWGCVDQFRVY